MTRRSFQKIGRFFPLIIYIVISISLMIQGVLYFLSDGLMSYHMEILNGDWYNLSRTGQYFIVSMVHGSGIASFCLGTLLLIITLIPYRKRQPWAIWTIPVVGIIGMLPLYHITRSLHNITQAHTPHRIVLGGILLLSAGFLVSFLDK